MRILVLGAGMYVTGRHGSGSGTILSALCELSRSGLVSEVCTVSKSRESGVWVKEAADRINALLQTSLPVTHRAIGNGGPDAVESFADGYDAAIISLPDHLHHSYGIPLLRRGIATLIVKPLTPSLAEAKELVAAQEAGGAYAAVEFHKRWDETNLLAKKFFEAGELGQLLYSVVGYSQRISIPSQTFSSWASTTNIFQYLGVHYVDLFYFLTKFAPVRISAIGTDGILKANNIDTWDSVHATIVWRGASQKECIQHISCNWIDPDKTTALSDQKYQLIGTNGRLDIDQKNRGMELVTTEKGVQAINPYFSEYLPSPDGEIHFQGYGFSSIKQFITDARAINSGAISVADIEGKRPTLKESLISTAVIDSANKSLKEKGEWVTISL